MRIYVLHFLHPTYNRASQESQEIILDYPCAQLAMQNSTQRYTDGRRKVRLITHVAQLCMAQLHMLLNYAWLNYTCCSIMHGSIRHVE